MFFKLILLHLLARLVLGSVRLFLLKWELIMGMDAVYLCLGGLLGLSVVFLCFSSIGIKKVNLQNNINLIRAI